MELVLTVLYAALFSLLILRLKFFEIPGISRRILLSAFYLKLFAGFILSLVYTYYYTNRSDADIFKYFDDSKYMADALWHDPISFFQMLTGIGGDQEYLHQHYYIHMNTWYNKDILFNDNRTMIRFNAFVRLVSLGYYQVHSVAINSLCFVGLTAILKVFAKRMKGRMMELFCLIFLMPSVLFWGSGVLKDGLLLFAMGLLVFHVNRLINHRRAGASSWIWILACTGILSILKFYVLLIMLPGFIGWYWSSGTSGKWISLKFLMVYGVFFVLLFLGTKMFLSSQYEVSNLIYYKQMKFYRLAEKVHAGSVINNMHLENHYWDILMHIPQAFYNTLCRPWFFEHGSWMLRASGVENLLLLLYLGYCLITVGGSFGKDPRFWFACFFVLILYTLIGLVTPVLGAVVRYKVPGMVMLMICASSVSDGTKRTMLLRKFKGIFQGNKTKS